MNTNSNTKHTLPILLALAAFGLVAAPAVRAQAPPPPAADPAISQTPPPDAPQIHPPFLTGIHPGTPFLWTVHTTGAAPFAFTAPKLPRGLSIDKTSGIITGSLARPGDYAVAIRVQNKAGQDSRTIHIVAGPNLALTPPMGWNSYDAFGDDVTETEVLANAQYLHQYLQPLGWDTVVVDFRWYDPGTAAMPNRPTRRAGVALAMDASGRLLPAPTKFPAANGNGFKPLADQIHSMGLRFGIHIMRGIPRNAVLANTPIEGSKFTATDAADTTSTCPWCPDMYGVRGNTPAGQAYYDSLFRLYASWGVDFVKVDDMSRPYHTAEITAVRQAIDKCGRSIVLSLSPGATPVDQAPHVQTHANMWREADDFWDNWKALDAEFALGASWRDAVGPGHWPDADMLPLGHLSVANRSVRRDRRSLFTHPEQMTLLSLWALLPSPLMVGANLPDNDPWTLALLSNPEVIAINQDAKGAAASRVPLPSDVLTMTEVWSKPLSDGSLAVGLFNRGPTDAPMTVNRSELGLSDIYNARDIWQGKDIDFLNNAYTATIPAHGVVLLRLTPRPFALRF